MQSFNYFTLDNRSFSKDGREPQSILDMQNSERVAQEPHLYNYVFTGPFPT